MSGWTPALRIARRELLRAKGRSLLVLLLVLLPVTAVVALSTLLRTADVDPVEGLPRDLGSASARLDIASGRVEQSPDLRASSQYDTLPRAGEQDLLALLPAGAQLLPVREEYDSRRLVTDERAVRVSRVAVDLADEDRRGPYRLLQGTAPSGTDEIAVSQELRERGADVGDTVELSGERRTVTAVVELPRDSDPQTVLGAAEAVDLTTAPLTRAYVTGAEVSWEDVQALNGIGVLVLSRSVVLDPPPGDQVPQGAYVDEGQSITLVIIGLITVMGVLEVVLLAGPAFAVGVRRQRRSLALMAATGAEPAHVRRVVLAQGVWTGVAAVALGVPLGLLAAALARAPLARYGDATFGPFDAALLDLVLVSVLAAGTGLLAALLPAWLVARQPVVAALTGRRVTGAGAGRPALLGLVLLGTGLALTASSLQGYGRYSTYAEVGIAAAAIPTVLGAVLLAPAALALVGRLAGRLPLALRFAVRDADRQRGRTAPAVAAIAATVAGVVALGTAASSDAAQDREQYRPSGPPGVGVVTAYGQETDYALLEQVAREALPDQELRRVTGIRPPTYGSSGYTEVQVCRAAEQPQDGRCFELSGDYSSGYGSDLLVGTAGLAALEGYVSEGMLRTAERDLAAGRLLLTGPSVRSGEAVELRVTRFEVADDGRETATVLSRAAGTAVPLQTGSPAAVRAVLPDSVAEQLGGAEVVGLAVGQDLSGDQEQALVDAVGDVDEAATVRVERGYQQDGDRTVLLVLSLVAGVLVLAGTLAATSLALSEARPDLATLGQVGARPRTRRLVAGGYALVLGLVGALLGVAAGLVPGIAVAVPLTSDTSASVGGGLPGLGGRSFVLDLPWTLLLLVLVVLPLVSAAVSAAAARGRYDGARRVVA